MDVDGRIMEFINAETRVPSVEDQVWQKPDDRIDTAYQSVVDGQTLAQSCTAIRPIDNTKDFNLKTGKMYTFYAGYKLFDSINASVPTIYGDSESQEFMLDGATGLFISAFMSVLAFLF